MNTTAAAELLTESVTALTEGMTTSPADRAEARQTFRHVIDASTPLLAEDGTLDLRPMYQALEARAAALHVWDVAHEAQRFLDKEDAYRAANGL